MVDFHERDTRRDEDLPEEDGEPTDEPDAGEAREERKTHDHTEQEDHHQHDAEDLGVAIVTVSSTRTIEEDASGDAIASAIEGGGHEVVTRELVGDDFDTVQRTVDSLTRRDDVALIVTTGGTGVTPDDVTIEAVRPLFEKELPGFGELFRRYSEEEIGTRVVLTRATAGIADRVPVFCLPGSENAARLGVESVILPEAGHLVGLSGRGDTGG